MFPYVVRLPQWCIVLCILCVGVAIAHTDLHAQTPALSSISPQRNAVYVHPNSPVVLSWNTTMNVLSLTSANIRITGSQTGVYSTSAITYSSTNNTVTLTPSASFKPGELMTVNVTTGVQSLAGVASTRSHVWSFQAASAAASGSFSSRADVSVGSIPTSIALGDVNGDGYLDIATANYGSNSVSIRLGNGEGGFNGTTSVSVGSSPYSVALGDANGDGYLDIVTANSAANSVSVRLGDGTGNFSGTTEVAVGSSPYSVALGDVNGDGDLDVVTANYGAGTASVRLGDGTGSFSGTTEVAVGNGAANIVLGDMNGDGYLDIVTANQFANTASVRLGDGSGGFTGNIAVPTGSNPYGIALGDINRDGLLDIVTANVGSNSVSVHFGNGLGGFYSGGTTVSVGSGPHGVALGDVDGDGTIDIVTANFYSNDVSVCLGNGISGFGSSLNLPVGNNPRSIILGDVDGNGILDIVAANSGSNNISIRSGLPNPPVLLSVTPAKNSLNIAPNSSIHMTFSTTMNVSSLTSANIQIRGSQTGLYSTSAIVYTSTNNMVTLTPSSDFKSGELITVSVTTGVQSLAELVSTRGYVWSFQVASSTTGGLFTGKANVLLNSHPRSVVLGDINNDGYLDMAATHYDSNAVSIQLGGSMGEFGSSTYIPIGGNPISIAFGDVNGDGNLDFATANNLARTVSIRLGNGMGSFSGTTELPVEGYPQSVVLGDVNNDGHIDVVIGESYRTSIYIGNGTGRFSDNVNVSFQSSAYDVKIGDVNNDGNLDIVTTDFFDNVFVYLGNGTGSFSRSAVLTAGRQPYGLALGDINHDGNIDIITANTASNNISIYIGDGVGNFSDSTNVPVGYHPYSVVLCDVNGDGRLDVVTANYNGNSVSACLGDGMGGFSDSREIAVGRNPIGVAVGDINADGFLDIVSANNKGNSLTVWFGSRIVPSLISVFPSTNAVHVLPRSDIQLTFSTAMNVQSLTSANIRIRGSQTGVYSTSAIIYDSTRNTIILTPSESFKAGEVITVSVSTDVQSLENIPVEHGTVWRFTVRSDTASGFFSRGIDMSGDGSYREMALGDVNSDGHIDMAIIDNTGQGIIYFNDGTGSFSDSSSVVVTTETFGIFLSDVNNDGNLDVVTRIYGDKAVIRLGNGVGGFSGDMEVAIGSRIINMVMSDVNNDGHVDIVAARFYSNIERNALSVYLGDGTGYFSDVIETSVSGSPASIALGDINADGNLDIATTNQNSNDVSLYLGNGTGSFRHSTNLLAERELSSITFADVNNDSNLDIVTTRSSYGRVLIYMGDGRGNFSSTSMNIAGWAVAHPVLGDINGDGNVDIAIPILNDRVAILLGNGIGGFTENATVAIDRQPHQIRLADMNNDGKLDIATISRLYESVSIRFGTDAPSLLSVTPSTNALHIAPNSSIQLTFSTAMNVQSLTSANIRITGSQTGLYSTSAIAYNITSNTVTLTPSVHFKAGELISINVTTGVRSLQGVPITCSTVWSFMVASRVTSGSFVGGSDISTGFSPASVALGDMNGDGYVDIVTANKISQSVLVHWGDSREEFNRRSSLFVGGAPRSLVLSDMNGDRRLDIATADSTMNSRISIHLGNDGSNFSWRGNIATFPSSDLTMGDVNGDGNSDIVVASSYDNKVSIRLGDGTGNFVSSMELAVGSYPSSVALGDVNGDGRLDIAVAHPYTSNVSIYIGDGKGTFRSSSIVPVAAQPVCIVLGDVNGDGHLDIATANASVDSVSIRLGNGVGAFSGGTGVSVGRYPSSVVLGDVNGDGHLDIVTANSYSNDVTICLGDGTGSFQENTTVAVGNSPQSVALGDVNNDGYVDIVTANYSANTVSIRLRKSVGPTLQAVAPSTNALYVPPSSTLRLSFNRAMNVSSLTSANIRIMGSQTGLYSTSAIVYNTATNTITLTPSVNFKVGELVSISATTGIQDVAGISMSRGIVWNFLVASATTGDVLSSYANISVGNSPSSATFGDINGDGYLDIVTANSSSNSVSICLGDGRGGCNTNGDILVGSIPYSIAVGDMDNDGKLDIVTANYGSDNVSVCFGDGAGSISSRIEVSVGSNPTSVVVRDVNGDGNVDIVTTNSGANSISVRLGDGTGGFYGATEIAVGGTPHAIALGDINRDGMMDFATANGDAGSISIRFGDGMGGCQDSTELFIGGHLACIALGDIDRNGYLDIATAQYNANSIAIRFGDSLGNFYRNAEIIGGNTPCSIDLNDVNGDGNIDIATTNYSANSVSIHFGDGFGRFVRNTEVRVGSAPRSTILGDMNNDGMLDVATANLADNSISIHLSKGAPTILAVAPSTNALGVVPNSSIKLTFSTTMNVSSLTSANIRITGSQTGLYSTSAIAYNSTNHTVTLTPAANFKPGERITITATTDIKDALGAFLKQGKAWSFVVASSTASGSFSGGSDVLTTRDSYGIALGDVNSDGYLDIVTANYYTNRVSIRLGDGSGSFRSSADVAVGSNPRSVILSDMNNDGYLDIVTGGANSVSIRLGDGAGNFRGSTEIIVGNNPSSVVVGDVNNDGNMDIVAANNSYRIGIRLGDGRGSFSSTTYIETPSYSTSVALGDVNNDGNLDVIVASYGSGGWLLSYLGNGTGSFNNSIGTWTGQTSSYSTALGDINGDGFLDVATANYYSGNTSVHFGDGTGKYGNSVELSAGFRPTNVVLGDVNGDRAMDIVVANNSNVLVFLNNAGDFSNRTDVSVGSLPTSAVLGDINGDGILDIATAHTTSGYTAVRFGGPIIAPVTTCTASALNSAVQLSWTPSTTAGVTGYQIYHGIASGVLNLLATVSSATTTYTHMGLTDGATHFYAIKTVLSYGTSMFSTEVSAAPNRLEILSPDGGEEIRAGEQKSLQWLYSGDIHEMSLEYSTDNSTTWTTIASVTVAAGNKPLARGEYAWGVVNVSATTALFRVVSTNPTISATSANTFSIIPIPVPTGLTASASSNGIFLSWDAVYAGHLHGYALYRGVTTGNLELIATTSSTATTQYLDSDVTMCTRYVYAVSVIADFGSSSLSDEVEVVSPIVASVKTNGPAVACSGDSITLTAEPLGMAYVWSNGATSQSIVAAESGVYSVVVSSPYGCSSSASMAVTVSTATPTLYAQVLLEGAYSNDSMYAALQQQDVLPTNQPYSGTPLYYAGTETLGVTSGTAVVDWVVVDLRSGTTSGTLVWRRAALLRSDGMIVSPEGGVLEYPNLDVSVGYYVVVWHRNHIGVMSSLPVSVNGNCVYEHNFKVSQSAAYAGFADGQKQLAAGVYAMAAGDAGADGIVNAIDRVAVRNASNQLGYVQADVSLDGIVNAVDRVLVRNNAFWITQIP